MYEDLTDEVKLLDELLAAIREASATINQLYHTPHDTKKDVEEVSKMVKKSGYCIIS
jgi:predicted urease superfamily metal-dependent hydrolase